MHCENVLYMGLTLPPTLTELDKKNYGYHRSSGVETGGSGGSMNRGPELLGAPSSGATNFFSYTMKNIAFIV